MNLYDQLTTGKYDIHGKVGDSGGPGDRVKGVDKVGGVHVGRVEHGLAVEGGQSEAAVRLQSSQRVGRLGGESDRRLKEM